MDDPRKPKKSTPIRWYYTRRRIRLTSMVAIPVALVVFILMLIILTSFGVIPPLNCQFTRCVPTVTPTAVLQVMLATPPPPVTIEPTRTPDPRIATIIGTFGPTFHPPTHCFDRAQGFKDKILVKTERFLNPSASIYELYVVDLDGNRCWLANNIKEFAWSHDGQFIVMSDGHHLSIMSVWTQQVTTFGEHNADSLPMWTRNDKQIIFNSGGKLYVRNVDDRDLAYPNDVLLSDSPSNLPTSSDYPGLSPDGTLFAVIKGDPDPHNSGYLIDNLYVSNTDGSNQHHLTTQGVSSFDWSPDSKRILFISGGSYQVTSLYTVAADGNSQPVKVGDTTDSDQLILSAKWSVDGKKIIFNELRQSQRHNPGVYEMNADGSHMDFLQMPHYEVQGVAPSPCVNGTSAPPICG